MTGATYKSRTFKGEIKISCSGMFNIPDYVHLCTDNGTISIHFDNVEAFIDQLRDIITREAWPDVQNNISDIGEQRTDRDRLNVPNSVAR